MFSSKSAQASTGIRPWSKAGRRLCSREERTRLQAKKPARPGEGSACRARADCRASSLIYGAPRSSALWLFATHLHWIKPLFLPSPEAVWAAFLDAWHGRFGRFAAFRASRLERAAGIRRVRAGGAHGGAGGH